MLQFLFDYSFARYALMTGLMIGLICPLIGLFIVARRLSVIGEVLSHMSLVGIAIGSLVGSAVGMFTPKIFGLLFAVIGAILVELLRKLYVHFSELAIPILLSFGIGLGVVIFSASNGFNADFAAYLFGNLLAVNDSDIKLTFTITAMIIITLFILYKELLAVTFDEEHARVSGIHASMVQWIFTILIALTISVTVQAVGVMLVSGLMILPVAAGMLIAKGFKQALLYSILFSELSIMIGLILSYHYDLASGGAIIISALGLFILTLLFKKMR